MNTITHPRSCQDQQNKRRRPQQNGKPPDRLTQGFGGCTCIYHPSEVQPHEGENRAVKWYDWSRCPVHAAINLWNIISVWKYAFILWEGKREEYDYKTIGLRKIEFDWIWLTQSRDRRIILVSEPIDGTKHVSQDDLIDIIRDTIISKPENGPRYRQKQHTERLNTMDTCDEPSFQDTSRLSDIDYLRLEIQYECDPKKRSELMEALDALIEDSWRLEEEGNDELDTWQPELAVPRIRVPMYMADRVSKLLPLNPGHDLEANRKWWLLHDYLKDYTKATDAYSKAERKLSLSTIAVILSERQGVRHYLDCLHEVENEQCTLSLQDIENILASTETSGI